MSEVAAIYEGTAQADSIKQCGRLLTSEEALKVWRDECGETGWGNKNFDTKFQDAYDDYVWAYPDRWAAELQFSRNKREV